MRADEELQLVNHKLIIVGHFQTHESTAIFSLARITQSLIQSLICTAIWYLWLRPVGTGQPRVTALVNILSTGK